MLRLLWLPLLFLAQPADARVVRWHLVTKDGYTYYMPPPECLTGPLPRWRIIWFNQEDMDYMADYEGTGFHLSGFNETVNGIAVIYLVEDLPEPVLADTLAHEFAHLRGCEHGDLSKDVALAAHRP